MGTHARKREHASARTPIVVALAAAVIVVAAGVIALVALRAAQPSSTEKQGPLFSGRPTIHEGTPSSGATTTTSQVRAEANASIDIPGAASGQEIPEHAANPSNVTTVSSLPAPTGPDVEPDNDVDAETGEQLPSSATGQNSGTGQAGAATTSATALPDNDVSVS